MKTEHRTALINTLLAAAIGLCGIGCLSTAFALESGGFWTVLLCLIFAAAPCFLSRMRHGRLVLPAAAAIFAVWLFLLDGVNQIYGLIYAIMGYYHSAYQWRIPDFLLAGQGSDMAVALALVGSFISFNTAASLTGRSTFPAVFWAALPLIPCLIVTDTVPADAYLLLTLACIAILVLTASVRRTDGTKASRLTALLLVPVLLFQWLLFGLNPKADYVFRQEAFSGNIIEEWIEHFSGLLHSDSGTVDIPSPDTGNVFTGERVSLRTLGPRNPSNGAIMTVTTDFSGTLYLRGKSYYTYDGVSWMDGGGVERDFTVSSEFLNGEPDQISVTTKLLRNILYLPYYPGAATLTDGALANTNQMRSYSQKRYGLRSDWKNLWSQQFGSQYTLDKLNGAVTGYSAYLELPEETLTQAQAILDQIALGDNTDALTAADRIAAYVRGSATYDQDTATMPSTEPDFAIWFLQKSPTGYCVHFASATVVLLRAAGIPARYVEGYSVPVTAGQANTVSAAMAHAWVEYYLPGAGWIALESTPSDGQTVPDTPTTVPDTTPDTTAPTVPDTTPDTTAPDGSTGTTGSTAIPSTTGNAVVKPPAENRWLVKLMTAILVALCAAGAIIGQWLLRIGHKRRRLSGGTSNERALRCWREVKKLAWLCRETPPEELHALARKAKFSQHTLTDGELAQFGAYSARCIRLLRRKKWYQQLLYRVIFAAY